MKHRLLILGTLGEFVQLVKKSKERGHYTIVCDGYPDGPARQYADASYVIPVTDIDAVAELCQKEKVDGIITSFSDLSPYFPHRFRKMFFCLLHCCRSVRYFVCPSDQ